MAQQQFSGCASCSAGEPGWACSEHLAKPFPHDDCGAEGVQCRCNPRGAVQWQTVFAEADDAVEGDDRPGSLH